MRQRNLLGSVDVSFSNSAPRVAELALAICECILQKLAPEYRFQSEWTATLYAWYIRQVAFINVVSDGVDDNDVEEVEEDVASYGGGWKHAGICQATGSHSLARRFECPKDYRNHDRSEVDFIRAYEETQCGAMNRTNTTSLLPHNACEAKHKRAAIGTRRGMGLPGCFDGSVDPWEEGTGGILCDDGFRLLLDFLLVCCSCSEDLGVLACRSMVNLFAVFTPVDNENIRASHPGSTLRPRGQVITVDVAVLSELFVNLELCEEAAVVALGSATRSFNIWMGIAWSCASFARQVRLAAFVSAWLSHLCDALEACRGHEEGSAYRFAAWVKAAAGRYSLSPRRLQKLFAVHELAEADTGMMDGLNWKTASILLREVFEGQACSGSAMMESLFSRAGSSQLLNNYVSNLLAAQGPALASSMLREDVLNCGSQPILFNITSGMLSYVGFYLSLRSLRMAQQCANLAIKIGQQLHSNHVLAVSHYSSFIIQLSSGRTLDAADSISVALQLSAIAMQQPSPAVEGNVASPPAYQGGATTEWMQVSSLCYDGAAELLLFYPGTVGGSLRSILTGGLSRWRNRGLCGDNGNGGGNSNATELDYESDSEGKDLTPPIATDGLASAPRTLNSGCASQQNAHAMTAQSVAQTVRHVLCLAEAESLLQPRSASAWMNLMVTLSREALLMAASIYGVHSRGRHLEVTLIKQALEYIKEESVVHWVPKLLHPLTALLASMARHTAHKLLMVQEGRAWYVVQREGGPLHLARCFLRGIWQQYGAEGLRVLEADHFFLGSLRYVQACWLARNGYMVAAYDLLRFVAHDIYRLGGVPNEADESGSEGRGCAQKNREKALVHYIRKLSSDPSEQQRFWPSDHLFLLTHVQHKRGELALYLGDVEILADLTEALAAISTHCSFVYGTLVSQLLHLLCLQQKSNFAGLLQAAASLSRSARAIGLDTIVDHVCVRQVTALCCTGQWLGAMEVLEQLHMTMPQLAAWKLLSRFTAGSEALLSLGGIRGTLGVSATMSAVRLFVRDGLHEFEARGYLGSLKEVLQKHFSCNDERNESVGVSLHELLCLHTAVARAEQCFFSPLHLDPHNNRLSFYKVVPTCTSELVELLSARQHLCLAHERLFQRSTLDICQELLRGELVSPC